MQAGWADASCLAVDAYGLVSPMTIIRTLRLSLFAGIALKSPHCLVDLLSAVWVKSFGWVQALRSDLLWLSYSGMADSFVSTGDVAGVFASVGKDPRSFIRIVRKYASSRFANFDVPLVVPVVAPTLFLIRALVVVTFCC